MQAGGVLEVIELKDILNHFVAWLMARDKQSKRSARIQRILKTALREFGRENWAQSAEGDADSDAKDGGLDVVLPEM
jgi:hypothetical protein